VKALSAAPTNARQLVGFRASPNPGLSSGQNNGFAELELLFLPSALLFLRGFLSNLVGVSMLICLRNSDVTVHGSRVSVGSVADASSVVASFPLFFLRCMNRPSLRLIHSLPVFMVFISFQGRFDDSLRPPPP